MSAREWQVFDTRDNTSGTYYTLTQRTTGTLSAPLTVKHTKYDTFACLTCLSVSCAHARFVEQMVQDGLTMETKSA